MAANLFEAGKGGSLLHPLKLLVVLIVLAVLAGRTGTVPAGEQYAELHEELSRYVASFGGKIGLYFEDLTTGTSIGIDGDTPFLAGSTIKVPLVLYLYTLAREGEIGLDEHATIRWDDLEEGTGFIRLYGHGSRWTLRELAEASLSVSDNTAANALLRTVGRAYLYRFMKETGGRVIARGPGMENVTSPRDLGRYFKALMELEEAFPGQGDEPLRFLSLAPYDDRITAYLPWEIRVAHKTGNFEYMVADAGIVYLPGRPYVLSVFVHYPEETDDYDEAEKEAAAAIADISYIIYRFQAALAARVPGSPPESRQTVFGPVPGQPSPPFPAVPGIPGRHG